VRLSSSSRAYPGIVALLSVLVIVPTAGILWFMAEAMRNERAAVRESLTAAYQAQLSASALQVEAFWEERRIRLDSVAGSLAPPGAFASLVREGLADSVIVHDALGNVRYPWGQDIRPPSRAAQTTAWREAEKLEFAAGRLDAAAQAYAEIARTTKDNDVAARALQAQARCLGKAGRTEEALAVLTEELGVGRYRAARDAEGRLIVPQSLLLALYLPEEKNTGTGRRVADELGRWLAEYGEPAMPAAQRRFLAGQLQELLPGRAPIDTMAAEDLADRYLRSGAGSPPGDGLNATALPQVWQLASTDGLVVALYREATVSASLHAADTGDSTGGAVELRLVPPGSASGPEPFLVRAAGGLLPGWQITLHLADREAIDAAADEEMAAYLWTGTLLIAAALIFTIFIARILARQMRLAKLKNDLVATVTHELRTPLASTRLLVDTLLAGEQPKDRQTQEYLELISGENQRLSRLIDDFLSFSRMERNKQVFEKERVEPGELALNAADAVRGRFQGGSCRFDVEIEENLPAIEGDPEALLTVLVNLLDNAWKYTPGEKEILLRAGREDGEVVLSVRDNGVGLSRRAAKRVFNRFYRVDDSLTRSEGGMGLGLAIVRFIVDAHGGEVSVDSRPGEGSTFTIRLKAAGPAEQRGT
jgi:signal transduction histidine kinase